MTDGLEFSAGSLSVVDSWLGNAAGDEDIEPDASSLKAKVSQLAAKQDDEPFGQGRAARLGLGAKFLPGAQSRAVFTAEQKMIQQLKKKKRKSDDKQVRIEAFEEQDAEESRTSSVGKAAVQEAPSKTKKSKKQRKKEKDEKKMEEKEASAAAHSSPTIEDEGVPVQQADSEENTSTSNAKTNETPSSQAKDSDWKGFRNWKGFSKDEARKRRKTRSKRKNMRKDNRPADQKPTYLDPNAEDYDPHRGGTRKSNKRIRQKQMAELKKLEQSLQQGDVDQTAGEESTKTKKAKNTKDQQPKTIEEGKGLFFIDKTSHAPSSDLASGAETSKISAEADRILKQGQKNGKRKYKNIVLGRHDPKHSKENKKKKTHRHKT